MPDEKEGKGNASNLWDELKDDMLGYPPEEEEEKGESREKPTTTDHRALPIYMDEKALAKVCKGVLKKRNLRHCTYVNVEMELRPYWFFAYTCELKLKDENGNIIDSDEVGGRQAIDAEDGILADYLPDTIRAQPTEFVTLTELQEQMPEAKTEPIRIKESELSDFIKQKIAGVLHASKDDVSVAGFEVVYAPVWKAWFQTKKKEIHNIRVCAFSGYPLNIDELPLHERTWRDVIEDDISALKDPKKWSGLLKGTAKGVRGAPHKKHNMLLPFLVAALVILLIAASYKTPTIYMAILLIFLAIVGYYIYKSNEIKGRPPPMPQPPGQQPFTQPRQGVAPPPQYQYRK